MKKCLRGFTLVEILIVLAITGVLAAIAFPVFGRVRENGRRTTCQSNLKQLNLALSQYVSDNDSVYPDYKIMPLALLPYVKARQIFECPTEENTAPFDWDVNYQTDYTLNAQFLNKNFGPGQNWRGIGESKTAQLDISRVWTLADFDSNDNSSVEWGKVPSACGGDYITAPIRHASGSNYAFADGHVKWLDTQGFADILCYLKTSPP